MSFLHWEKVGDDVNCRRAIRNIKFLIWNPNSCVRLMNGLEKALFLSSSGFGVQIEINKKTPIAFDFNFDLLKIFNEISFVCF